MKFIKRLIHNLLLWLSVIVRCFTRVKPNRVMCSSYTFTKYSCNPKYISEYLHGSNTNQYEIYWVFKKHINCDNVPSYVKIVRYRTLKYFWLINTSEYIFSNCRMGLFVSYFTKRPGQKYIMTWHSSMGIKRVEKDACQSLPAEYIDAAKYDSSKCDLIISGCAFRSRIIKGSFWYNGEILEAGTPRNDILFRDNTKLKERIYKEYNIDPDYKILLYAPTFRSDYDVSVYKLDWQDVIATLTEKYNCKWVVMLRLHPNFISQNIAFTSTSNDNVVDVTLYQDMQELLAIADLLVTDYSSSVFDFSLLLKPCFIYATDIDRYDRGLYINLRDLPYPYAKTNEEFNRVIRHFDYDVYREAVRKFIEEDLQSFERGEACKALHRWMISCQLNPLK